MAKLLYQGHASIRITTDSGKVIFVDPYAGEGYEPRADLVLITHEHYDHNAVQLINMDSKTIVLRSKEALKDGKYFSFDFYGIHIQAVPAYNQKHSVNECVGYIIDVDGVRVYHGGDTSRTGFMSKLKDAKIDYLLLPIDGIYNMGPQEATECAELIQPKQFIPIHMKPGALWDINQDMKVTASMTILVRPGDEINLIHKE